MKLKTLIAAAVKAGRCSLDRIVRTILTTNERNNMKPRPVRHISNAIMQPIYHGMGYGMAFQIKQGGNAGIELMKGMESNIVAASLRRLADQIETGELDGTLANADLIEAWFSSANVVITDDHRERVSPAQRGNEP